MTCSMVEHRFKLQGNKHQFSKNKENMGNKTVLEIEKHLHHLHGRAQIHAMVKQNINLTQTKVTYEIHQGKTETSHHTSCQSIDLCCKETNINLIKIQNPQEMKGCKKEKCPTYIPNARAQIHAKGSQKYCFIANKGYMGISIV